jgi:hypothetical protein
MGPLSKPLIQTVETCFLCSIKPRVGAFPKQGVHEEGVVKFETTIWEWTPTHELYQS